MPHTCSLALVRCIDYRLTRAINKWMEEKGVMNDCDVISVAGVSRAIAQSPESEDAEYLLRQLKLSKDLHQAKTIHLIHHTDCGAYGGRKAFESFEKEWAVYAEDMKKATEVINRRIPDVVVECWIADIKDGGEIQMKKV